MMPDKKKPEETTAPATATPPTDGARSFSSVLMQIADGDAHEQLSQDLQALVRVIQVRAKEQAKNVTGTLTFKLKITGDPNSTLDLGYEIKHEEPKPRRPRTIFWADKNGNVTATNPRQYELPMGAKLRDVKELAPTREAKDDTENRDA
jgi:hypothetical protein